MKRPQVVFFDAVGTLFGVRGSVGQVYREIARAHGVEVDAAKIDRAFYESFKASPPCTFPGVDVLEIPQLEQQWWNTIAQQTFDRAGVLHQFADFSEFFSDLYYHFETAKPWFIYPDTVPTLEKLRSLDIPLGVLSNFDSRLYKVLKALNLEDFFDSITISTEVGVAKPDPKIFAIALEKHDCQPENAWHIGDSQQEDYEAANAAGLRGILLNR
ncbi:MULTISPECIES: HAD-IA family hydrolase [Leptolyngbya]|jgi:putative hydrolase of the HAD superfamily|uniref:HAD family hydrolase n=2 Tax=Leptolyngbya boryana TaxID=1184 RepID=A0A1Z4JN52_LEPBY|nr:MULTISPECIES: HAD family hydrolase [Leptolyngbya]BAY58181.1 HAD family hydrolase [Leptolyngbya boryana NIES-2135]MBD1858458.1 HAD family hydrolase [Leptolyngbya sp. FACHB-1624]MBD2369163.1 HAD family hydrolase [Leptolyngbya sp. FACHB-161]MBD2375490.1 HAD family hydrolase [Leptolyngbya sp. FACHB-238]MBD2400064.1 HAD family hydrolase [Leptolyngbya sp. FACHB-239]